MTPYYEQDGITIYHGDCREVLPTVGHFDLLLADPPYGLGDRLESGECGEWSGRFTTAPEWDKQAVPNWLILQAVDHAASSIVWGGNYYTLPIARGWLAWDKMQEHSSGHFEMAWTNLQIPTRTFRLSRVQAYSQMGKEHPTQKPEALMLWCLGLVPTAQSVLDPFMGSGTTLVAAKRLGKTAVGIELNEAYCEIAAKRLSQGALPLEMGA